MVAVANLVHETSSTTGTSDFTLSNVSGKQSFNDAFGTGGTDAFFYFISNRDASEWECGTGHLSASTTLVRDTVIDSSNSGSAVNFSVGTKDVTNDVPAATQLVAPKGHIYGLNLSNNGTDGDHDIDIAVGEASSDDSSPILMKLTSALTKQADATWAAGDAAGGNLDGTTLSASGTVHWWLISDASGTTVDVACSDHDTSGLSPTLPSGYTKKRRIGSVVLDASSNIRGFSQNDDFFMLKSRVQNFSDTTPSTSKTLVSCVCPEGIIVELVCRAILVYDATGAYIAWLNAEDDGYTVDADNHDIRVGSGNTVANINFFRTTNTSGQIAYDSNGATVTTNLMFTLGWIDPRG